MCLCKFSRCIILLLAVCSLASATFVPESEDSTYQEKEFTLEDTTTQSSPDTLPAKPAKLLSCPLSAKWGLEAAKVMHKPGGWEKGGFASGCLLGLVGT